MTDEALRHTDQLLSELTEIVETARTLPMSTSCVLPRERVLDLLDELRDVLPPEMDEARTVIATRDRVVKEAYESAERIRERAVADADAVLEDARHQSEQQRAEAEAHAAAILREAQTEHGRLVSATAVHQAATAAAAALRHDAEQYAAEARAEAERYATKLTADAEDYAERTLDELSAVLHKAAATAEQGRATLRQRRAGAWAADRPDTASDACERAIGMASLPDRAGARSGAAISA